jgi:hypothetical protein
VCAAMQQEAPYATWQHCSTLLTCLHD